MSFTGTDRPALKYLKLVRGLIAEKWYDIGLELLEQKDEQAVKTIKKNPSGSNLTECCTEMLELWLDKQPNASWNQLIETLKTPGIDLNTAASKIEDMLLSSTKGNELYS